MVQFYGVYLVENNFPVIVWLSKPLKYTNSEDRTKISRGILAVANYIKESINLHKNSKVVKPIQKLSFSYESFFYKPIRCESKSDLDTHDGLSLVYNAIGNVDEIMFIYERLHKIEKAEDFFSFPVGLMSVPAEFQEPYFVPVWKKIKTFFPRFSREDLVNSPVIIYKYLDPKNGWSNKRPPCDLVEKYLVKLAEVISILSKAKVAHMDLRPHNIMWRWNDELQTVDIQIIDFEDAVIFGGKVRNIEHLNKDAHHRYPPMSNELLVYASNYHNDWFLCSIQMWLADNEDDKEEEEKDFGSYMFFNYSKIEQKILENGYSNTL
jgi:hypothetical protein